MKKNPKIFLVDDEPEIIEVITAILEASGYEVLSETSSDNAIARIEDEKPDCVLIDIMMPGKDGLELCREIKANKNIPDLKVVVVSAKTYEFDKKRAFDLGADGFINKPINPETFVESIAEILEDVMELSFWGVRGTLPVPGERSLRYGGNTPCISLEFSRGDFFIFDAGSGIKELSNHLLASSRSKLEAKIFISHPHWDHINALPFFVPLYVQGNEFEILGAANADLSMREMISAQMDGVYFPITLKEFASRVYFRDLREETIEIGDITVKTMLLSHPGYCLGYRVEYHGRSICYITDNELFLEDDPAYNPSYVKKLADFIRGTDALITDCTYMDDEYTSKVGWGHSCVDRVVDLADQAEVKNLYLFHHDPDQDDDAIDEKLKATQAQLKKRKSTTVCLAPAEGDKVLI
jgi:CheY-like chemotaxis protein/phosphoribosyl 1,2-cyclic phosphodiesterase